MNTFAVDQNCCVRSVTCCSTSYLTRCTATPLDQSFKAYAPPTPFFLALVPGFGFLFISRVAIDLWLRLWPGHWPQRHIIGSSTSRSSSFHSGPRPGIGFAIGRGLNWDIGCPVDSIPSDTTHDKPSDTHRISVQIPRTKCTATYPSLEPSVLGTLYHPRELSAGPDSHQTLV